mmetsp:Transcript_36730/g.82691  ORF Transcript_36730/g.82691 Transcript_36730/m.82691 type:complete len:661 (-) Transcript_36730:37-2019(-)
MSWRLDFHTLRGLENVALDLQETASSWLEGIVSVGIVKTRSLQLEVQVGAVVKRSKVLRVKWEQDAEVEETLFVPIPDHGEQLVVRLFHLHQLRPDTLVGKAVVLEPGLRESVTLEVEQGEDVSVVVSVEQVACNALPVSRSRTASSLHLHNTPAGVLNEFADRGARVGRAVPLGTRFSRRPLSKRRSDVPTLGYCRVVIEGVSGLSKSSQRPYFVLHLEGQEYWAEDFWNAAEVDLTYDFAVGLPQSNLRIYCYDDCADRNKPLGRMLVPLSDLFWGPGSGLSSKKVLGTVAPGIQFRRRYTLQFMPVGVSGDCRAETEFLDRFLPAVPKLEGSGMRRGAVFGKVTVRLELTLIAGSVCLYAASMMSGLRLVRSHRQQLKDAVQADVPTEPNLIDFLQHVDLQRVTRNLHRLERFFARPPAGLVYWLQADRRHGFLAGFLWYAFCLAGLFPPPLWAWPIYVWCFLLTNGLLAARQRKRGWGRRGIHSSLESPGRASPGRGKKGPAVLFDLWNEDIVPETMAQSIKNFQRAMSDLEDNSNTFVSFLERIANVFNFADGSATLLVWTTFGFASLALSMAAYLWFLLDGEGRWSCGILGGVACVLASQAGPATEAQEEDEEEDPFQTMTYVNQMMSCVPDDGDLAHHYIATRVQCLSSEAVK